jgi:uncharacterized membrane protein
MSTEPATTPRSRRWPRRRPLGTAPGPAVVVGTGAAACASPYGGGFLHRGHHGGTGFNQALGINDTGTIVGYFDSGKDRTHPHRSWTSSSRYAAFRDVRFPGSVHTQVGYLSVDQPHTTSSPAFNQLLGISRNGIAAGFWNDEKGRSPRYLWSHGRSRTVDAPWHGRNTVVNGINDKGLIVGSSRTAAVGRRASSPGRRDHPSVGARQPAQKTAVEPLSILARSPRAFGV